MPVPTFIITDAQRDDIAGRIRAGANEHDSAAFLTMPVERVKRMLRRDLEKHAADAKHEVLSTLFAAATSGDNINATIFSAKARFGLRDTGTPQSTYPKEVWKMDVYCKDPNVRYIPD
jgi:hypothetical protein